MLQEKHLEGLGQPRRPRALRLWRVVLPAILIAGLSAGGWWVWHDYTSKNEANARSKNIGQVRRGNVDIRISSTGTIRPFNQVKLSPKFTGLLKTLYVQQGDSVKRGQVVAAMDESNLLGQLQAATAAYLVSKANFEKQLAGNRPQELADLEAQLRKSNAQERAATMAINHARSDIVAAKAQLQRDEVNANRLTDLHVQGAVSDQERLNATTAAEVSRALYQRSQQDMRQTEAALNQAKADVQSVEQRLSMCKEGFRKEDIRASQQGMLQAKGNMDYVKSQMEDTFIRAPFDGVVAQKYADSGAIVTPTTASTTNSATSSSIISLAGRLEMVASVSESDIDHIHVGQPVEITASAYPTRTFHGHVALIAPEAVVTQNVTSFEVHATIDDDKDRKLMSGMNVNSDFVAGKKSNVLLIPTSCVVTKKGKTGVFIPDKQNNPDFKPVNISTTSDSDAIVNSGLNEGDKIFVSLTKEQLIEQGYSEKSILGPAGGNSSKGRPDMPRSMKNKL